jgi:hypothetical protein
MTPMLMMSRSHHYEPGPFAAGTTVKLKEGYARALMRYPHCKTDWLGRRGTVTHSNPHGVMVLWSGRKSLDQLPVGAVEEVTT